jgi:hypothetical protein
MSLSQVHYWLEAGAQLKIFLKLLARKTLFDTDENHWCIDATVSDKALDTLPINLALHNAIGLSVEGAANADVKRILTAVSGFVVRGR